MLAYYSIDEVSQKSGLSKDQILRLGFTGTIVFSILDHSPVNYEEVEKVENADGSRVVKTTTNTNMVIVKKDGPLLRLKYISPEDVINVVVNEAPNRKTLIRAFYETRDIDPKKGTLLIGGNRKISVGDLVVSQEEWERFTREEGKSIRNYLPLAKPEKITLAWLFKNLTVSEWLKIAGILMAAFSGGAYFSHTEGYKNIIGYLAVQETEMPPNKSLKAQPSAAGTAPTGAASQNSAGGSAP